MWLVEDSGVPAWEPNTDLGACELQPGGSLAPGCNVAAIAEPFGVLGFLAAFGAGCP